ncbi:hypothetical protein KVR01_012762 [Diaporthe batatas]|uniref:uncharacterized protein n=1 Tax=Diaporthe batatas TaxID=748121 RepID=UPI001D041B80|nr:uncharacterized protein KVR01_012762 [Diaporthe batatas]KAG8157378.1 hypothetical protein KVR01_012762 [Diaporthe batatas]
MVYIRPAKEKPVAKDETRRRAARAERAEEEKQDDKKCDKTQRLSKWETSTSRPIDEGCELALSEDVVLPTDDWKTETGDIQLAILASLGLLDDYEAEDADITLNSLPRNEDIYTIRYKPGSKKKNARRCPGEAEVPVEAEVPWEAVVHWEVEVPWEAEVPMLDDDVDWELVLQSQSEGSMSWTMLDE